MNEEITNQSTVPPPPELSSWVIMMVPIEKLFMDRRYQRGLIKTQVKRLVNGWDWDKYHPISIAHRVDGRYAVIAGQQRTTAALELGIPVLPAILRLSQDVHQEAKQFVGSGATATISPSDKFKARLMANEQKAFDIWQLVEKCGFTLRCMRVEDGTGAWVDPFAIDAVGSIESIFDTGYLDKTLTFIHAVWGSTPTTEMTSGNILRGTYLAIRHLEFYGIEFDEFKKKIHDIGIGPKEIVDRGLDRYRSMTRNKVIAAGIAAVMIDNFNYRRREQVPDFTMHSIKAQTAITAKAGFEAKYGPMSEVPRGEHGQFLKQE
jgi:hypothetical protein